MLIICSGFGDTKILPRLSKQEFETILKNTVAYENEKREIDSLWSNCCDSVFSCDPSVLRLGMEKSGVNTYYSKNMTQNEVKFVQEYEQCIFFYNSYLDGENLQSYNNRLFKHTDGSYEIRMASVYHANEKTVEYHGRQIHVFVSANFNFRLPVEIMLLFSIKSSVISVLLNHMLRMIWKCSILRST